MIDINPKNKIKVHWNVSPYDYTKDKEKEIISAISKKYTIQRDRVTVAPNFVTLNSNGDSESITNQVIENIQDPAFQQKLFMEYLKVNDIKDYDYEFITAIDKDINDRIDYQVYDKLRKFRIKWIKFDNFQSYGSGNCFDFSNLHGLVLLNGEPANQSGKTTFAVDLFHFLLFGKTSKAKVQEDIFNKYLSNETNVVVEGCFNIDGEDYIIKRTLSRPKLDKRTAKSKVTQKVEYYRVVGDNKEELDDFVEIETGEDTRSTNKIIKESIGREEDFDLIMCITGSNLNSLIDEKPTDRGRLFSRWIGLLPLEAKNELAREKFNTSIKPSLDQQTKRSDAIRIKNLIQQLKTSEYCPTCGKKLDNVDNSKQIKEQEETYESLVVEGKKVTDRVNELNAAIEAKKENREKYNKLNALNTQKPIVELNLERLRNEYKDLKQQEKEYLKNSDAIDKNNKIELAIRNTDINIKTKRDVRDGNLRTIAQNKSNVEVYKKEIAKREEIIAKINQEDKIIYNWKIYLDMVGKNGISKMVMRKTLPIINARLNQLLEDVCDFDVNVDINLKNEVTFNIVRNGVVADLNSGSGFEKTASALALRTVLADISTIPQMNFLVLDEILSGVAFDNYDNIFSLISKSLKSYDFAFFITHVDAVKEYTDSTITIKKEDNVSKLYFTNTKTND